MSIFSLGLQYLPVLTGVERTSLLHPGVGSSSMLQTGMPSTELLSTDVEDETVGVQIF